MYVFFFPASATYIECQLVQFYYTKRSFVYEDNDPYKKSDSLGEFLIGQFTVTAFGRVQFVVFYLMIKINFHFHQLINPRKDQN